MYVCIYVCYVFMYIGCMCVMYVDMYVNMNVFVYICHFSLRINISLPTHHVHDLLLGPQRHLLGQVLCESQCPRRSRDDGNLCTKGGWGWSI